MGFGMQSWIYKKCNRKPFAKRHKLPSFSPLQKYSRDFGIKPHEDEDQVKRKNAILTIVIVLSFLMLCGVLFKQFYVYSTNHSKSITAHYRLENEKAFNYLYDSGIRRLSHNNLIGAYSELKLACQIDSKNEELNKLLIETLSALCSKDLKYCIELENLLKK